MRMRQHSKAQNTVPNNLRNANTSAQPLSANNNMTQVPSKATRIKDQRDMKAKRNEWRITKMVLAIFLSFVMCYLPITIAKIVDKNVSYPGM